MGFRILYDAVLLILSLIYFPKFYFDYLFRNKYRKSFGNRLGKGFRQPRDNSFLIWIHAVSMGETKAIVALSKKLKTLYPHCTLILSSITETGHQEAKKSLPEADFHVFLPFDLSFIIRPIIKKLKPRLIIVSETDLWFNFLDSAKKEGAKIFLVNGKISERSCRRYKKIPIFLNKIFALFDHIYVQNDYYQNLFASLGIPSKKMTVTGNMKFDEPFPVFNANEIQQLKNQLKIRKEEFILVIGSSHDPEEMLLLKALKSLLNQQAFKIILVPRHPERFDLVSKLLDELDLPYGRFSCAEFLTGDESVILVDAMGVLKQLYQIADAAIVAGSFTEKVGGHNVLEPCFYGVPVLFGPYMFSQRELKDLVLSYQAGKQVGVEQIREEILAIIENRAKKNEMGKNGLRLVSEMNGSTERTLKSIQNLI